MSDVDRMALERWATRRDAEAFNALASRHAPMVYATCRRVLGNATDAEDVAQECFEALAQVGKARKARSLGAWLHGMATKRSLQRLRSEKRRRAREARFFEGRARSAEPVWDDVYEHVDAAIAALPDKLRVPVVAHFLEGHSHTTIARNLGESRQTVAYRIKTGIDRIRVRLRRRGVLVTGDGLDDALTAAPSEAMPQTLAPALGKLALSGVGPSPASGSRLLSGRNYIVAGILLVLAGVGAWVALTPRSGEPDGQPPGMMSEERRPATPKPEEGVTRPATGTTEGDAPVVAGRDDASEVVPDVPEPTEVARKPSAEEDGGETVATPTPEVKQEVIAHAPVPEQEGMEVVPAPLPEEEEPVVAQAPGVEQRGSDAVQAPVREEEALVVAQTAPAVEPREEQTGDERDAAESPLEESPVGQLAALDIEVPEPSFSGTPLDYWSPNLEMSFKPRPKFYVPKGTQLLSRGRPVTCSDVTVVPEKLALVSDGDKGFEAEGVVMLKPGVQYVQVDLETVCELQAIVVWHFHEYERVYHDVVVVVSNDAEFSDAVVVFNNDHDDSSGLGTGEDKEYVEKAEGKLIDVKGAVGRYVRLYSNGNSSDDSSTYIEVEVFGRAAE